MKTSFWNRLLDVVSPRCCVVCGRRLSSGESVLCAVCHLHLPLTHLEQNPTDNPMARLFWGQIPIVRAAALFHYEPQSEMARIIYDLKYNHQPDIGISLGVMAARLFIGHGFFDGIDAIVPIPITRARRWHRGYNQSEQIARGISEVTHLPIYNKVVVRQHFKESQSHKNAMERRENVANAFRLANGEKIAGKHLLLIDDIVTTGSTIIACAQQLCLAPKVSVSILSLGLTSHS
jgi:ComF family protein